MPPLEPGKVDMVRQHALRHARLHGIQVGAVADPGGAERHLPGGKVFERRQPVEWPLHRRGAADIDDLQRGAAGDPRLLGGDRLGCDPVRHMGMCVIGAVRLGRVAGIMIERVAALQQRHLAVAQDVAGIGLGHGNQDFGGGALGDRAAPRLRTDERWLDHIDPGGIVPLLPLGLDRGQGGPVADQPADGEAQVTMPGDGVAQRAAD